MAPKDSNSRQKKNQSRRLVKAKQRNLRKKKNKVARQPEKHNAKESNSFQIRNQVAVVRLKWVNLSQEQVVVIIFVYIFINNIRGR